MYTKQTDATETFWFLSNRALSKSRSTGCCLYYTPLHACSRRCQPHSMNLNHAFSRATTELIAWRTPPPPLKLHCNDGRRRARPMTVTTTMQPVCIFTGILMSVLLRYVWYINNSPLTRQDVSSLYIKLHLVNSKRQKKRKNTHIRSPVTVWAGVCWLLLCCYLCCETLHFPP